MESQERAGVVVVGLQWGDEGKGKIVDALAEHFDIVARYQGGANAGHTVRIGGRKFILQLIPTGILRPEKIAVIGQGVVVDPEALHQEFQAVEQAGVSVGNRLIVSDRAHLIFPYHRSYEAAAEVARGAGKIGTTSKGIGPAYEDKAGRRGLRAGDLRRREIFLEKCRVVLEERNRLMSGAFRPEPAGEDWVKAYFESARWLVPRLADVSEYLNSAMDQGRRVLFEGAQGTLLDLDHGTYPYVTSSSAAAGGATTGTGVGPTRIGSVIGVSKAYATRVGSGPFPTEALGPPGERLRGRGGEYGAVTGRPRRCGWFDVPAARYAARLNHLRFLIITKLDVLDELEEIPVGVEYRRNGKTVPSFPAEIDALESVEVTYRTLSGWREPTSGIREFSKLPDRARQYLHFLEREVGVEIAMVSTGPERGQEIWRDASQFADSSALAR